MTDSLTVFGTDYTGVTGIKAYDDNSQLKTYIRPQGTKSISANGTGIDVTSYASVDVSVPTGTARTSADLTVSGDTVTAPAGLYANSASASVAAGTEGTPTATKGTVSDHAISVTPSVTNSAGYISGGTKTGTAVTVTASELASGNLSLTANTNSTSCVGYSTVSVAVPIVTYYTSSSNPTSSQGSNGDIWLVTS